MRPCQHSVGQFFQELLLFGVVVGLLFPTMLTVSCQPSLEHPGAELSSLAFVDLDTSPSQQAPDSHHVADFVWGNAQTATLPSDRLGIELGLRFDRYWESAEVDCHSQRSQFSWLPVVFGDSLVCWNVRLQI